ncbi:MAG: 6-phosphofructokinase [Candidatus Omnitrophota bacterium]|jgi:6-phosphofructokinase 1|nr:MAG: 6-phosphofructokinase [Candidatus Omnitrophota bacterium]
MKRIGVMTSGGESSGMNAAIRSVVRFALHNKIEVMGIFRGFKGLINEEIKLLNHRSVSNIINLGGTILKTSRCPEFLSEEGQRKAVDVIKKNKIEGLILIGGNGTYNGAIALNRKWQVPCIGVPGTIDNDISGTDFTIGSDTAVNVALDALDKIRDTATSMERIFVVEVMGRESGFIALQTAVAGGTEEVLLPEKKFDLHKMCEEIVEGNLIGKISWIIIVAEGAAKAAEIASQINSITGLETREVVLGHIQRGGRPTARDRIIATSLGVAAVELLLKGEQGKAVGIVSNEVNIVDLEYAIKKKELKIDKLYNLIKILT